MPVAPMLETMVRLDLQRPWLLAGAASSVAVTLTYLAVAYAFNFYTSIFTPPRTDWFDILNTTMMATMASAIVSAALTGAAEARNKVALGAWAIASALGFTLLTGACFIFTFLVAMP